MSVPHTPESPPLTSQSPLIRRKPGWRVVLGKAAWSRHTYERPQGDALKLLGSVRKGMQLGALAMTADDQFVLVVGDHITALNTREIAKALANAPRETAASNAEFSAAHPPRLMARKDTPAPVVVVKKRRVAVMP